MRSYISLTIILLAAFAGQDACAVELARHQSGNSALTRTIGGPAVRSSSERPALKLELSRLTQTVVCWTLCAETVSAAPASGTNTALLPRISGKRQLGCSLPALSSLAPRAP